MWEINKFRREKCMNFAEPGEHAVIIGFRPIKFSLRPFSYAQLDWNTYSIICWETIIRKRIEREREREIHT